jgi:hypothetical protein
VRVEMGSRQTSTLRHYFYNIKPKLYYYDRSYSYLNATEFYVKKPLLRDYLLRKNQMKKKEYYKKKLQMLG